MSLYTQSSRFSFARKLSYDTLEVLFIFFRLLHVSLYNENGFEEIKAYVTCQDDKRMGLMFVYILEFNW